MKEDDYNRFSFSRTTPVDQLVLENRISEEEKMMQDTEEARNDHDRVIAYQIE